MLHFLLVKTKHCESNSYLSPIISKTKLRIVKHACLICGLIIIVFISILFFGCAATGSRQSSVSDSKTKPSWIENHPTSSTHFIGVGSAQIQSDLAQTQEQARMNALKDIAQQIEVTIISDITLNERNVTINNKVTTDQSIFQKKVRSLAQAALQDWEIQATWIGPDGFLYCKVVLEKKKYYDRVNKKVNDAIALATDALEASERGPFDSRLRELYKGLIALDDFLGNAMKSTVGGKEVILNNELPRRLQQLLSSVEIRPNINRIALSAAAPVPDSLGALAFVNGNPDSTIALSWTASVSSVETANMPTRSDGLRPVLLKTIPASAGVVQVTATIDCGTLTYDLLQRKFMLPSGSFSISRQTPRIFLSGNGSFCKQLLGRLTSCSAAISASSRGEADFILSAQSSSSGDPVQSMGIYRAKALLALLLTTNKGKRVLDVNEEVSAADAQDGSRAQENAQKVALEKAVKLVEGAF
jgi:LPP20 lipoprotein